MVLIRRYATGLHHKQNNCPVNEWDWSFLEYYRKGVELETDPECKLAYLHCLKHFEASRDFAIGSIKQINPLIQFDPEPNHELKEARVELYKISISFTTGGK